MTKTKLPKISTLQKKCDKLLTPIVQKVYPKCLFCKKATTVGHHHIKKERCAKLRYNLNNIVPLCRDCHYKLHKEETYWASKIVAVRGVDWFNALDAIRTDKTELVTNRDYYNDTLELLEGMYAIQL